MRQPNWSSGCSNDVEWVEVAREDDLKPGRVQVVELDDISIAVFNLAGEYYAIEDVCTHDGSEISSGCLYGYAIECPRHGARFDIRTGEVLEPPAYEPVRIFPVQTVDGVIQIRDDRWD